MLRAGWGTVLASRPAPVTKGYNVLYSIVAMCEKLEAPPHMVGTTLCTSISGGLMQAFQTNRSVLIYFVHEQAVVYDIETQTHIQQKAAHWQQYQKHQEDRCGGFGSAGNPMAPVFCGSTDSFGAACGTTCERSKVLSMEVVG